MANKNSIVEHVLGNSVLSKSDARQAVDLVFESIKQSLLEGGGLTVSEFGKFTIHHRPERVGRNPSTGEEITIPAANVVKFKPAKFLSKSVN